MGRKSESGAAILEAALHTFWVKGYEGVGVNEICAKAGVNKGTLYHFYRDKEDLILGVIEKNSRLVDDFISRNEALPADQRILSYFDMMREGQRKEYEASGHVAGCPFGNLGVEMANRNEKVRGAVNQWFERMVDFLSVAIRDWKGSDEEAKCLADELFTIWQGALLRAKTANSLSPIDKARQYTLAFLAGIKKAAPDS